jgi:hypothetical protein
MHHLAALHHRLLGLARHAERAALEGQATLAQAGELRRGYARDVRPLLLLEERVLFPALELAGEAPLVERACQEHAEIARHAERLEGAGPAGFQAFAALLREHVRFEERTLLERARALLEPELFDALLVLRHPQREGPT